MRIDHVALAVRDPDASLRFYRDVIGIDGPVRAEDYGYVILTGDVSFTLFRAEPPPAPGDFHIGASLSDAEEVRQRRRSLAATGVREIEWSEEPGYVSVKVEDPDGYRVELSWDEHQQHRP